MMKLLVSTVMALAILTSAEAVNGTRARRFIGIRKGSSFFLRVNFKDTILPTTTIFVHAAGFKIVWPVPEGSVLSKKRVIRSLYDDVEYLFDRHGFDGKSCLLNNICQATEYVTQNSGVIVKILRLLLRYSNYGNDSSIVDTLSCENYKDICPLEFVGADALLN